MSFFKSSSPDERGGERIKGFPPGKPSAEEDNRLANLVARKDILSKKNLAQSLVPGFSA